MAPSTEEDFHQISLSFLTWFKQLQGAKLNSKLEIVDMRNRKAGRGIVALMEIEENEELFSIRHSDVLAVWNSSLHEQIPAEIESMDQWMSLILTMVYEDSQRETSKWWQYLNILPKDFDTLMYWSPAEIAELQACSVTQKIGKDDADTAFTQYLLPVVKDHAGLFGDYTSAFQGPNAKEALLSIAHRMGTLIMAYAFDLETEAGEEGYDEEFSSLHDVNKVMVPLADILNADGELTNAYLQQRDDSLTMIASKTISKGQQIFNDYGHRPRSDLLRRYGYITENAKKWDVVELSVEFILKVALEHHNVGEKEMDKRLELAKSWNAYEDGYDLCRPQNGDSFELDTSLLLLIHACTMDQESFEEEMSLNEAPEELPVNLDMALLLRKLLYQRQCSYATSIAEDTLILQNPQVQGRHRMAVEIRLGEKEILANALDSMKKKIEDLNKERSTSPDLKSTEEGTTIKRRRLQYIDTMSEV